MDPVLGFCSAPIAKKFIYSFPVTDPASLEALRIMKNEEWIPVPNVLFFHVSFPSTVVRDVDILMCSASMTAENEATEGLHILLY